MISKEFFTKLIGCTVTDISVCSHILYNTTLSNHLSMSRSSFILYARNWLNKRQIKLKTDLNVDNEYDMIVGLQKSYDERKFNYKHYPLIGEVQSEESIVNCMKNDGWIFDKEIKMFKKELKGRQHDTSRS